MIRFIGLPRSTNIMVESVGFQIDVGGSMFLILPQTITSNCGQGLALSSEKIR
ncbi:hypothetical protein RISK_002881 [Rhodopirellula islandica]|uniref:Uncharacterized protein n=1 Tax=Rhodopirellula islandica TaxID=595434 RepID=A0A0J1EHU3_RHOIS|nr:hypothetical protein RISK_002881 [Rhodopirellula islandica]